MKAVWLAALLLCSAAQAQVYKWVDAKGVTHYSDQPPPPSTKTRVEVKSFSTGAGNPELPPELADAARNRPVTLYTTGQCEACNAGRQLLITRGIPYREKTVNSPDDVAVLKKAGSAGQLPLLVVGRAKNIGFEEGSWNVLLSDAGYPPERLLPANYQNPPPAPAAPPPEPSAETQARAAAKAAQEEAARNTRPPAVNAPPGFQF